MLSRSGSDGDKMGVVGLLQVYEGQFNDNMYINGY